MKTVICMLLLAFSGCNTATHDKQPLVNNATSNVRTVAFNYQIDHPLNGKWRLIPALPADTATGRIPVLNFIIISNRIIGNTGCNNFSGTFSIEKNSLTFNNDFVSTKMACAGYDEAAFERNLLRTNNFEINGDTLSLKDNQTPLSYWLRER